MLSKLLAIPALALAAGCASAPLIVAPPSATSAAPPGPAASAPAERLAPGVVHRHWTEAEGPWAVHLVEVDPTACGIDLRSAKAADRLVGRERTSALAAEVAARTGRPVLAGVNADFFTGTGVPVGAQVVDGELIRGPGPRAVFGVTESGRPFIDVVRLEGRVRLQGGYAAPLTGVNTRPGADSLSLYTRFVGDRTPVDTGAVEIVLRRPDPDGAPQLGVVVWTDTAAAGVERGGGDVVLSGRGRAGRFLQALAAAGDTVRWDGGFTPAPGPVREMVGGLPELLRGGVSVLAQQTGFVASFSEARHPRTAVGWRADGTILLLVVDGRQPGYSEGMTLAELTALMQRLGATDALNLDGGGSTTVVLGERVANRPSDREGERPVANAIFVLGPAAGQCATSTR